MEENIFTEPELTSTKLSDFSKIPTKDFEKQFREWMERDDVARSLQAKLRYDLIANFNKTSLGRHIISQTTMTTSGAYGYGNQTQRLTLSPLILALNTLVAEFLYAANCHFSLSIFCTEVPFRNTLPNFEQKAPFRFTSDEINEILQAIMGHVPIPFDLKGHIIQKYIRTQTNASLLLLLLQSLVERILRNTTETKYVQVQHQPNPINITKATMTHTSEPSSRAAVTYKTKAFKQRSNVKNILNANFRRLNRYLATLTHKISENVLQWDEEKETMMPTKFKKNSLPFKKGSYLKSYLINMTEQLKQMSDGKQYNRQLNNLQQAIMQLGQQFENCANNLCMNSKDLEKPTIKYAHKAVNTIEREPEEKSYAEWVHELRETRNGQKFLDRIENSLRKALHNQKLDLQAEANFKLEQQKAILKIHYRQKLLDHIARESQTEIMSSRCHGDLEEQLKELQIQYRKLLQRIENSETVAQLNRDAEETIVATAKHLEASNIVQKAEHTPQQVEPHYYPTKARKSSKSRKKKMYDKLQDEKQLKNHMENLFLEESAGVNNLVVEAKLRLLELDKESNQLENNLSNCLERQRMGKKLTSTDSLNAWEKYTVDRHRDLDENTINIPISSSKEIDVHGQKEVIQIDFLETKEEELLEEAEISHLQSKNNTLSSDIVKHKKSIMIDFDVNETKFTNPIALAKKKFFENESRMKYRMTANETISPNETNRLIETSNLEISAECINNEIIPKLSTFLENVNESRQQTEANKTISTESENEQQINKPALETSAAQNDDKKNETIIILQKSTDKLNKLFSCSNDHVLTSSNESMELVDRTFIKKKS